MGAVFIACLSAGSLKQNIFKGRVTYIGRPHSVIVIAAYKVMAIVDVVVQPMASTQMRILLQCTSYENQEWKF